jgi:hypothetical protein
MRSAPSEFVASGKKESHPHCKKCSRKMRLIHSLPRTRILPAMQVRSIRRDLDLERRVSVRQIAGVHRLDRIGCHEKADREASPTACTRGRCM